MKLYYSKGACSLAIHILLIELGINFELERVEFPSKKTETGQDYLQINPKGSVPALELDDQQILTENAVIQQYLVDLTHNTQLLPAVGDFRRYRVLEWLNFVSTDLHKGCAPLFNSKLPETIKDEIFKPNIVTKLKIIDKQLAKNQFLMGEQFTLPDIYLFVILNWLPHLKIDISDLKNVQRYFAELKTRRSIKQALEEEGLQ